MILHCSCSVCFVYYCTFYLVCFLVRYLQSHCRTPNSSSFDGTTGLTLTWFPFSLLVLLLRNIAVRFFDKLLTDRRDFRILESSIYSNANLKILYPNVSRFILKIMTLTSTNITLLSSLSCTEPEDELLFFPFPRKNNSPDPAKERSERGREA